MAQKKRIDCKHCLCPMSTIVEVSNSIEEMESGDILEVETADPTFKADLETWITHTGNTLVSLEEGEVTVAVIQKS